MIDIVDKKGMTTIGIMEEGNSGSIFKCLKKILLKEGYDIYYNNSNDNIIILKKNGEEVFIINIDNLNIEAVKDIGLEFNIFIHNFINTKIDKNNLLNEFLRSCKYLILNCDQEKWNMLIKDNTESIIVTYGFNNKATVTLSSYIIDDFVEGNICFQRTINSIYDSEINPLELHIKLDSKIEGEIYSAIAAIIGASVFDPSIILEKSTISI